MAALEEAVAAAQRALDASRDGALERGPREQIWRALGPRDDVGRRRRARLAIAAVNHALPRWFAAYPDDNTPVRLLDTARAVLAGTADPTQADRERGSAWTHFDNLVGNDVGAIAVGYAAVQALGAALYDEDFSPDASASQLRDADVDADAHDGSYLASVAEAGGPIWQPSDAGRRRTFWQWWLNEAITEAR